MTHAEIIHQLGGYRAIAAALSLPITTAHSWLTRGIPAKRWPAVLEVAAERGVAMTWRDLAQAAEAENV